jgi:hypothetical protein
MPEQRVTPEALCTVCGHLRHFRANAGVNGGCPHCSVCYPEPVSPSGSLDEVEES